ncbi:unnamed protein product [Amoebophrya sp. A120]|nr:unnamed protein product [Amoebophrya sp. A120]|eukprot:GSA120T00015836001.1
MSDSSTRDSESPMRKRNKEADDELKHISNSAKKQQAALIPPADCIKPSSASTTTSKPTPYTRPGAGQLKKSSPSTTNESSSSKFFRLYTKPLLQQIATACNLKHYQDLRTFWLVGTYYSLVAWRWWLYKFDPRYKAAEELVPGKWRITQYLQQEVLNPAVANELPFFSQEFGIKTAIGVLDFCWIIAACSFAFFCATIVHNCIHFAQFKNYHVNTLWNIVLTHTYGHPVSTLIPGHNLSHHKYVQTPKDSFRTTRMRWRYNLINCLLFGVSVSYHCIPTDNKYFMIAYSKGNVWLYYRMRIEQVAYYPLQIYLAYNYFQQWWWILLIPQLWAKLALITMNMLQHDGCLVLRELGETPDPYIAKGSQTVVKEEEKSVDIEKKKEEWEKVIFDKDVLGEKAKQELGSETATNLLSRVSCSPPQSGVAVAARPMSEVELTAAALVAEPAPVKVDTSKIEKEVDTVNNDKESSTDSTKDNSDDNTTTKEIRDENGNKLWDPDFNFARDFVGEWINFFTCNNGFHTAHHLRPSCHWTKYPQISKMLVEKEQHPNLRVDNLVTYAFKCFVLGRRITWDGRPYFPNEPDYDVDWVDVFFSNVADAKDKLN